MATRSTIAVRHEDGTVSQIYCHWDGYLSHNGKLLMEHYNSLLGAEFLVSKGDLSVLAPRVTPDADRGIHTFDAPQNGVCVYYGRDRDETDTEPRRFDTRKDFINNCQREEYNYYFNGDWWEVEFDDDFIPLTIALAIEREAEGCE
jgi:hypothetical protein